MAKHFFSLLFSFLYFYCEAQNSIEILNKSLEDQPRAGQLCFNVANWTDCGGFRFQNESPPDVHPGNFWQNNTPPSDGKTYLGFVVRENETWEGIGQRLSSVPKVGKCYKFTIDLAQSDKYISGTKKSNVEQNYNKPAVLRIWGGAGLCDDRELLAETGIVNHNDWRTYQFKISPKSEFKFIMLEVFYKVPVLVPYNGHVLVDNMSNFEEYDCSKPLPAILSKKTGNPIASSEAKDNLPPHKRNRVDTPKTQPKPPVKDEKSKENRPVASAKTKILEDLDIKKIKTGSTIQVKSLFFKADTSTIDKSSYEVLDEILEFLRSNKNVKVEIGGHTNGIPSHDFCNNLSTERAKAVYDYLVSKGISKDQLTAKGYGKTQRIAPDNTPEGRTKNQRVELKILSIG